MARTSTQDEYHRAVEAYVAAGGEESVQRVISALYAVTRRLDQWYDRQLADLGITHPEWSVLVQLARVPDALTPSHLADATNVAPSSMTHRLDKMTERGWITRTPDPENRTRVLVHLTDAGRAVFAQAVQEANVVESDTLSVLGDDERLTLAASLERIIEHLDDIA